MAIQNLLFEEEYYGLYFCRISFFEIKDFSRKWKFTTSLGNTFRITVLQNSSHESSPDIASNLLEAEFDSHMNNPFRLQVKHLLVLEQ